MIQSYNVTNLVNEQSLTTIPFKKASGALGHYPMVKADFKRFPIVNQRSTLFKSAHSMNELFKLGALPGMIILKDVS